MAGAPERARFRGATRLFRGAPNAGGLEERPGYAGALRTLGGLEERPGYAGALRTLGGLGGHFGAPHLIIAAPNKMFVGC